MAHSEHTINNTYNDFFKNQEIQIKIDVYFKRKYVYSRSPQPLGHRPVLVHGILGTSHIVRSEWWVREQSFICIYSLSPLLRYCLSSASCQISDGIRFS